MSQAEVCTVSNINQNIHLKQLYLEVQRQQNNGFISEPQIEMDLWLFNTCLLVISIFTHNCYFQNDF